MRYAPSQSGDRAGLVAFYDDAHYYLMAVTQSGGRPVLELERRAGAAEDDVQVIASTPLDLPADAPLYLKIEARGGRYGFYYAYEPDAWRALEADVDGKLLSTHVPARMSQHAGSGWVRRVVFWVVCFFGDATLNSGHRPIDPEERFEAMGSSAAPL